MKSTIRKLLGTYINRPFVTERAKNERDVTGLYPGYFQTFGEEHPDKLFYVIWIENGGSGFFSNVSNVLCQISIAERLGMIPVVDLENFKTLYNEKDAVNNVRNAWEYYFCKVSEFTLEEVYRSKRVFFCDGKYPRGFSYSVTQVPGLRDVYQRRIRLNEHVDRLIEEYAQTLNFKAGGRILGVHFRGQEQKLAPRHSFPPTEAQMLRYCDELITRNEIDKIFIVTEDQGYLDLFARTYGDRVLNTKSFRTLGVNAYKLNPRENHRYLLGLEVLVDTHLLSKCFGLLCGDSNVSQLARFINDGQYAFVHQIVNGTNSPNPIVARYLYNWKKNFPWVFGPFKDQVLTTESNTKS